MNLAHLIKQARLKKNLTQTELSILLGYESPHFMQLAEAGRSKVPLKTLGRLISVLGLPEKQIIKSLVDGYKSDLIMRVNIGKRMRINAVHKNKSMIATNPNNSVHL
jgi:transcriptional regulator with XRE-family HTH domain